MPQRSLKTATISSLFWKLFEQGGNALITLVVEIVLARLLAPAQFGALAIMLVFVNVGTVIVQSGLNTAIIQSVRADESDYSTVFWMSLALSALLYLAIFLSAPAVASFYSMPDILWPLRVLMLVLLVNAYNSVQEAIVARELAFRKTFRATVTASATSGVIGIALAIAGAGLWALVLQQLLLQILRCIVLAAQVPWKPHAILDPSLARKHFRFGWKLLASGLLDQASTSLSDLIVGRLFTSGELGYVSQGKKYPRALAVMLDGAIQPVMLSATARIQEDKERVKSLARRALKTSTFLVAPAMTLFAVAAEPIVVLFLGEKWLPSVPFLQMYCIICALRPLHTTNLQVINGMGHSEVFLKLEVLKTALSIGVLLFCAFVLHDLYAIVGGNILVGIGCALINAHPNRRIIGYGYGEQIRDVAPAFLLSAAAGALAWAVSLLALGGVATLLLQIATMVAGSAALAKLLHIEAFDYLLATLREIAGR